MVPCATSLSVPARQNVSRVPFYDTPRSTRLDSRPLVIQYLCLLCSFIAAFLCLYRLYLAPRLIGYGLRLMDVCRSFVGFGSGFGCVRVGVTGTRWDTSRIAHLLVTDNVLPPAMHQRALRLESEATTPSDSSRSRLACVAAVHSVLCLFAQRGTCRRTTSRALVAVHHLLRDGPADAP